MDKVFKTAVILSAQDRMTRKINDALSKVDRRLQRTAWKSQQMGRDMMQFGAGLAAGLGYPLKQAADYERLQQSLSTLNQSAEKGAQIFNDLREYSSTTPFQLKDLAKVQNTLQGFNVSADESFETIKRLGDISAVTGGNMQAISVAYGQAAAEGKVMTRDIRQFINQSVPATKLLADTMGVATGEIFDLASQGEITFEILRKAFRQATEEGGMFYEGAAKQAQTLWGMWSTLTDKFNLTAGAMGETLKPAAKELFNDLVPILETIEAWVKANPELTAGIMKWASGLAAVALIGGASLWTFGKLLDISRGLISVFGMLAKSSVFLVSGFAQGISVFARTGSVLKGLTAVMRALNLTILANPFVLAAVAIAAAVYLIYKYWEPISNFFSNLWADISAYFKNNWRSILNFMMYLNPLTLAYKMWNAVSEYLFGISLYEAGKNVIVTLWKGMKAFINKPIDTIAKMAGKIRDYLPFSPAKEGPLKDLDKVRIVETVAENMNPGPAVGAMRRATGAIAGAGGRRGGSLAGVSSGGAVSINYNPSITINGGAPGAREDFMSILRQHKQELYEMVESVIDRKNTKRFG